MCDRVAAIPCIAGMRHTEHESGVGAAYRQLDERPRRARQLALPGWYQLCPAIWASDKGQVASLPNGESPAADLMIERGACGA